MARCLVASGVSTFLRVGPDPHAATRARGDHGHRCLGVHHFLAATHRANGAMSDTITGIRICHCIMGQINGRCCQEPPLPSEQWRYVSTTTSNTFDTRIDTPTCPQCAKLTAERDRLQALLNEYAAAWLALNAEVQMLRQRLEAA